MAGFDPLQSDQEDATQAPTGALAAPSTPPQAPEPTSSFEAFLRSSKAQDPVLQQAKVNTLANSTQSATTAQAAAPVGRQLGLPQAAVEADLPRFQQQALADKNNATLTQNPVLAAWVAANPDSARVAQDEYDKLGSIEKLWEGTKGVGYAALQGLAGAQGAAALGVNRQLGAVVQLFGPEEAAKWWYGHMIAPRVADAGAYVPDNTIGAQSGALVGQLAGLLSQIALTGGSGGSAALASASPLTAVSQAVQHAARAMAFPSLVASTNKAAEVYQKTGSMLEASKAAALEYAFNTAQGVVPFSAPGGIASRAVSGAASSLATSEGQRAAWNLLMPPEMAREFNPDEAVFSALSGAVLGGVMGPRGEPNFQAAIRQTYVEALKAEQATRDVGKVAALGQISAEAKLRESDPDAFKRFVQMVTDKSNLDAVYVNARSLQGSLAQTPTDLRAALPDMYKQLGEGILTGTDVRIPMADWATHIAGTDLEKALIPELKAAPDGMTMKEGEKYFKDAAKNMEKQAKDLADQQANATEVDQQRAAINKDVYDQLVAAGRTPDVARTEAGLHEAFYSTLAENLGLKPADVYSQFRAKISNTPPPEGAFSQKASSEIGGYKVRYESDGSITVYGDQGEIRSLLGDNVRGRLTEGGVAFTGSQAPQVAAILNGEDVVHGRAGAVTDNPRYQSGERKGQYIGAPAKYNTPAKIPALRRLLKMLTLQGTPGKMWYEQSGRAILEAAGYDINEARKLASLMAIYSPRAKVDANSTFAMRAWAQYKAGEPIDVKSGVQDEQATSVLYKGEQWGGEKTNNFYRNLMREVDDQIGNPQHQGVTVDMWMMRAAGYDSDNPTTAAYRFVENETNRIAQELGWEPQQVQAAIWVAMKARLENDQVKVDTNEESIRKGYSRYEVNKKTGRESLKIDNEAEHRKVWLKYALAHDVTEKDMNGAAFDFADGLARHMGQVSWEARPGRTTGILPGVHDAPYQQQAEFQQAVAQAFTGPHGEDMLAEKVGLLQGGKILAPGVWQGDISAGMQSFMGMAPQKGGGKVDPAQAKALNVYADIMGYLLRQEGVGWHKPFWTGTSKDANGVELRLGRPLTPVEASALWASVDREMRALGIAKWEDSAGLISSALGMRVVNFGALADNIAFRKLVVKAAEGIPGFDIDAHPFASDGDLRTNNWKENPDGQGYVARVGEAGRSDVLEWAQSVLAPRVQAVFDDFSQRYGWGDPGQPGRAGRAGGGAFAQVAGGGNGPPPRYGQSREGSVSVTGYHFSRQARERLDTGYYGRGLKGREAERLAGRENDDIRPRSYFYVDTGRGVNPEEGVGGHAHAVQLDNIYDAMKDPLGIVKANPGANNWERAIMKAGFDGYLVINKDMPQGFVALVGKKHNAVPVQALNPPGFKPSNAKPAFEVEKKFDSKQIDRSPELDKADLANIPGATKKYGLLTVPAESRDKANAEMERIGSKERFFAQTDEGPLGLYTPSQHQITILKGANLSTFAHESAHHFLEVMRQVASSEKVPEQIARDFDTLLRSFQVEGATAQERLAKWNSMTVAEQRAGHEAFARGWERYMMEGKAPTFELQRLYSRFRSWMLQTYKTLRGLNVQLSDEVREVMDRMMASEATIKETEASRHYFPLWKTAEEAGMSEERFQAYVQEGKDARELALDKLQAASMQDMKWADNAKSRALRALQREAAGARKEVRAQVTKEVAEMPIYKLQDYLKTIKNYDPDIVANAHGFVDADAMRAALANAAPRREVIAKLTDQRMLEQYGELLDPQSLDNAANAAVHNEARAKFMATGLKVLTKSPLPANQIARAAKEAADVAIGMKRLMDINPQMYLHAESRANKDAIAAAAKDPVAAIEAQRAAILSNRLAQSAMDARDYVKKNLPYLRKIGSGELANKIGAEYSDRINELLSAYDLSQRLAGRSNAEARVEMREWLQSEFARTGVMPDVSDGLLNFARRRSWQELPFQEFIGLVDSVKSLEHVGRSMQELTILGKKIALAQMVDRAVGDMADMPHNPSVDLQPHLLHAKGLDKLYYGYLNFKHKVASMDAALVKMEQLFQWLTYGRKAGLGQTRQGPFLEIFQRAADAEGAERGMRRVDAQALKALGERLTGSGVNLHDKLQLPLTREGRGGDWYREELLAAALNIGNEGNLKKMSDGYKWGDNARRVLEEGGHMSRAEWTFVQGVWDTIGAHWNDIEALQKRLTGRAPPRIEPREFEVKLADGTTMKMRGGYYPVVYDAMLDRTIEQKYEKNADALFENQWATPTTSQGHTVTRTGYVGPIQMSLGVIGRHLDAVTHDLAWREAVIDMNKFLSHDTIKSEVDQVMGREYRKQFRPWLQALANDKVFNTIGDSAWEKFYRAARTNATLVGLGFRLSTMLIHGSSAMSNSIGEVGASWFAKGAAEFSTPERWDKAKAFMYERSPEMANRFNEFDRNIHEAIDTINEHERSLGPVSATQKTVDGARRFAFYGVQALDMGSAAPTWMAAYLKGMANQDKGGLGLTEQDSVTYANRAVRNAHGGGGVKDLSAVQRDKGLMSLATMFYSFWNHMYNRQRDIGKGFANLPESVRQGTGTRDFAKLLARSWWYFVIPQVIHAMLKPAPGQEDDSLEGSLKHFAEEIALGFVSGVPVLRDLANSAIGGHDYAISPLEQAGKSLVKASTDTYKVATGEEPGPHAGANAIRASGYALGLPTGQLATAGPFLWDVFSGDVQPQSIKDWYDGVTRGKIE
jgi:hypothetical protein